MLDAENMHIVKSVDPGQPAHTGSLSWDNTFCRVWIIIMCCKQYFLLHVTSGRWVCKDLSSHLHYVADNKVCWGKLCSEWSFFCYLFTLVKSCCSFSLSYIFSVTCFHVAQFLARLAIGQRAYVMVRCPSCIRPCVIFFFKHLLLWNYLSDFDEISQKFSAMVLFRISWKNLIPSKTVVAMATKLKKNYLMGLYHVSSNYSPGVEFDPTPGVTSFTWDYIGKILENSLYVAMRPRVTKFCM